VAAGFHHEFLAVAGAAGSGNVGAVHAGSGVAGRNNFMRAAVAIHAARRAGVAFLQRRRVKAGIVGGLLVGVASSASRFRRRRFVRHGFYVAMAIGAAEGAVHGALELLVVYIKANLLATLFFAQGVIAVAGEAIGIAQLLSEGNSAQQEKQSSERPHRARRAKARGATGSRVHGTDLLQSVSLTLYCSQIGTLSCSE